MSTPTSSASHDGTRLLHGLPAVLRNGYWLVFSPDLSSLARISADRADLAETRQELVENGFIGAPAPTVTEKEKVIAVTLIVTTDCNLRCKYCFANAGPSDVKIMDAEVAFSALRYAAKMSHGRKLSIAFFGGEPTTQFKLIKSVVAEAERISKEASLPVPEFSITTNGVFNDAVHGFLVEHSFLVTLSADGPAEIQNFHRPAIHGDSSWAVERTIRRFVNSGHPFKMRATVTELSVHKMANIVRWYSTFGIVKPEIHFEPVSVSGRARSFGPETGKPSEADFIHNLKKAILAGNETGVGVMNSSFLNLVNSPSEFCVGDVRQRFAVTVDGCITRCVEVQDSYHPASELFILGKYDERTKEFIVVNQEAEACGDGQVVTFRSRKGDDCSVCFARRACGGGCPVRNFHATGQKLLVDPYRCTVTKEMIPFVYGVIDEASA